LTSSRAGAAAAAADVAGALDARRRTDASAGPDRDPDRLRRSAEELLARGRAGLRMNDATARYRQLELAQLLHSIARALEIDEHVPHEVVRHAANLGRHILGEPSAAGGASALPS
jgi:hypothetical protein